MVTPRSRPVHQTGSYRAWEVSSAGGVADMVWHSRVEHARPEMHRLLPFAEPSIVVRRTFDRQDNTLDCQLLVCPAQPDGGEYAPVPGEEQFAVRLAPEAMESALGMRAAEFAGGECAIPVQFRSSFDTALRSAEAGRVCDTLAGMLEGLTAIAKAPVQDHVSHAAQIMRRVSGRVGPSQLAQEADISARHLRREFGSRFGMSPRAMARRLRLTSAMMEAEGELRPDWAGVAAGHGFSDQSHLIRECRELLGMTPRAIHDQRVAMAVSFNT